MRYIKLYEELSINKGNFPIGGDLFSREKQILIDLVGEKFLDRFDIKKEDFYYYTKTLNYRNQFENFNELKDYLLFNYYINNSSIWILKDLREDGEHFDDFLKLYKNTKIDPSFDNNTIIKWATRYSSLEIVKILLNDPRIDPGADMNLSISAACYDGNVEVVKLLLSHPKVNPGDRLNDPIRKASEFGHKEIVEMLLKDPRVDPSAMGNEALKKSTENGYKEISKMLLKDPRVRKKLSIINSLKYNYKSR